MKHCMLRGSMKIAFEHIIIILVLCIAAQKRSTPPPPLIINEMSLTIAA